MLENWHKQQNHLEELKITVHNIAKATKIQGLISALQNNS